MTIECDSRVIRPYELGALHKRRHTILGVKLIPFSLVTFRYKIVSQICNPPPTSHGNRKWISYRKTLPLLQTKTPTIHYYFTDPKENKNKLYNLDLLETGQAAIFYQFINFRWTAWLKCVKFSELRTESYLLH